MKNSRKTRVRKREQDQLLQRMTILTILLSMTIGLLLAIDDLHDFVPGTEDLQFLPDFDPVYINGFQFHHFYVGVIMFFFGLLLATCTFGKRN